MATYRGVTIATVTDKWLDEMGYKVYIPTTVSGSLVISASVVSQKYSPHFKSDAEARKYIDYCKDTVLSADGTGTYTGTDTINA